MRLDNNKDIEKIFSDAALLTIDAESSDKRFKNQRLLTLVRNHRVMLSGLNTFLLEMIDGFQKALHQTEGEKERKIYDLRYKCDDFEKKIKQIKQSNEEEMKKAEEKLKSYIVAVKELSHEKRALEKKLKDAMKVIKAQKAAGSTINKDCMTGQCEEHRRYLVGANTQYNQEVLWLRRQLWMSWVGFGVMGALFIFFRKVL